MIEKNTCILLVSSPPWIYHWANFFDVPFYRIEDDISTDPLNTISPINSIKVDFRRSKDIFSIIESICNNREVYACYTGVEQSAGFAHLVSKKFNLPYQSCNNFNHINNKLVMRQIINSKSPSIVPAQRVTEYKTILNFVKKNGKSILKPFRGYGSKGILTVDIDNVNSFQTTELKDCMIEKFIVGDEYSVEAFSYHSDHKLIGITHKIVDTETFSEKGHIFPADLPNKLANNIWKTVKEYLTYLELKNGPSHTEIKVNSQGIYLIETHNRPGADHIPQLIELSTGFNTNKTAVGWCCKKVTADQHSVAPQGYAASYFIFSEKNGILKHFVNPDVIRWMLGVKDVVFYFSIGDRVTKTTSSFDRLGHIVVYGDSHQACLNAIHNVEKQLNIIIE